MALVLHYVREQWEDLPWDFRRNFISCAGLMSRMAGVKNWKPLVRSIRALLNKGGLVPHGIDPLDYESRRLLKVSPYMHLMDEDDWLRFADRDIPVHKLASELGERYGNMKRGKRGRKERRLL